MSEAEIERQEEQEAPYWLLATEADAEAVDLNPLLAELETAEANGITDALHEIETAETQASSLRNVAAMVGTICQMRLQSTDPNDPFEPMMRLADGRRSPIPSDFEGHIDVLDILARKIDHPAAKSRLADVAWHLRRKLHHLGPMAVDAYSELVEQIVAGHLKYRYSDGNDQFHPDNFDVLRRALRIGRATGWEKETTLRARALTIRLRQEALAAGDFLGTLRASELDLNYGLSAPQEIGESIQVLLADRKAQSHISTELWRLGARAFRKANNPNGEHACLIAAASEFEHEADAKAGSSILQTHFLAEAISQLHGVPGQRDKRNALRARLIAVQAASGEDMHTYSHEIDLGSMADAAKACIEGRDLIDSIFILTRLERSPEPAALEQEARRLLKEHPLSALFGSQHLDIEGKVISKTPGSSFAEIDPDAIKGKIAESEELRRRIVVGGKLEPARHSIVSRYAVTTDTLLTLMQMSPVVPQMLAGTFAHGFGRYLQGDFISATYILVPLLESILRVLLKAGGHDVSTFDATAQTQEDRTISAMFESMRSELDEVMSPAIAAEIERLFLNKPGPYLRHAIAHGLTHDGYPFDADAIYAVWFILRLCLVPLYPYRADVRAAYGLHPDNM